MSLGDLIAHAIRIGLMKGQPVMYRGTRIGFLYEGNDGYLRYAKSNPSVQ